MIDKYPTWNSYWEDKRPKLHHIHVPIYALASYSTGLHTEGSLRGYFLSSSKEKWYENRVCCYNILVDRISGFEYITHKSGTTSTSPKTTMNCSCFSIDTLKANRIAGKLHRE